MSARIPLRFTLRRWARYDPTWSTASPWRPATWKRFFSLRIPRPTQSTHIEPQTVSKAHIRRQPPTACDAFMVVTLRLQAAIIHEARGRRGSGADPGGQQRIEHRLLQRAAAQGFGVGDLGVEHHQRVARNKAP